MSKAIALQHEIVSGTPGIDTLRAKAYSSFLGHGPRIVLPAFAASVVIDLSQGSYFQVVATGSANFALANPVNVPNCLSYLFWIEVSNQSGGALGSISFGTQYKVPATAPFSTPPANGKFQACAFAQVGTQAVPNYHMWVNQSSDASN